MAALQLILHIRIGGRDVRSVTWDPLVVDGAVEESQVGEPWDWITSFPAVGTGQLIINIYTTERCSGNQTGARGSVVSALLQWVVP